jgi:hypothetical protein
MSFLTFPITKASEPVRQLQNSLHEFAKDTTFPGRLAADLFLFLDVITKEISRFLSFRERKCLHLILPVVECVLREQSKAHERAQKNRNYNVAWRVLICCPLTQTSLEDKLEKELTIAVHEQKHDTITDSELHRMNEAPQQLFQHHRSPPFQLAHQLFSSASAIWEEFLLCLFRQSVFLILENCVSSS